MLKRAGLTFRDRNYPVTSRYNALVEAQQLHPAAAQAALALKLDTLNDALAHPPSTGFGGLLQRWSGHVPSPVKGLYIWGGVGQGKTMLMDFFFEAVGTQNKRRVHFHAFMAEVHGRLQVVRAHLKSAGERNTDPIAPVARALAATASVLCFDEFAVTDIADAMLLSRLFKVLFECGVTVVATSNIPPHQLYEGGLNRALFLPFISLLEQHMEVIELNGSVDFRLEKKAGFSVYHTPADSTARKALDCIFQSLTGETSGPSKTLLVQGHTFTLPQWVNGVARASFKSICATMTGTGDYLALAKACEVLVLDDVPCLSEEHRNEAKRFITLIDTLYDAHTILVLSADKEPESLYQGAFGQEAFEFQRTASRLTEMRSQEYLGQSAYKTFFLRSNA